jgi:predicted ATPase/transcriptional regulator with XRE-family HTH domain
MGLQGGGNSTVGIGQRVRRHRTASGLSQQELARRARVSQPRISQIEAGQVVGPLPLRTLCDLADGLGVDLDALVVGDPVYDDVDLDQVRPHPQLPVNVPRSSVALVGRTNDVAAVVESLRADVRLLTLVGPGGVGKTQLALHACSEVANDFPEGMFFVSLAACIDPGSVVAAIARGVGLRERDAKSLRDRLMSDLPAGRVLLVLDNVEQAVSAVSALSAELLATYPDLTLLVTSRAPLNIQGERQHAVLPLELPDDSPTGSVATAAAAPAVELFVQRAREVVPGFALTDRNASQVVAICRRLDGLPLAIELAATRVRVFSPGQLLRQLERRLTFVKAGSRDRPARQRSLRASIAWSFDLLDPVHRVLLRRLAVFVGSFTLNAAAEITRDDVSRSPDEIRTGDYPLAVVAEGVSTLLEQHLLTRTEHTDGMPRFGMLETIHEYAREQLEIAGETALLSRRHLAWCRSLAERALPKLFTAEEPAWLDRLQQEDDNLQAALGWAFGRGRETALEDGLRLAGTLADYWFLCGCLSEGRVWLTRAVDLSMDHGPSIGRARSLVGSCLIAQTQAAVELGQAHGEQGLREARELGDQPTAGRALLLLGNLAMMQADLDQAQSLHEEALACFRQIDDRAWTALALLDLGMDFYRRGKLQEAEAYADDALAIARAIGDRWDTIATLRLLGDIARDRGDLEQASVLFGESLALSWRHDSEREAADCLSGLGAVAVASGDLVQAARLLGAAERLYRRCDIAIPPPLRPDWPEAVACIRAGIDADQLAQLWGSISPEQVIEEVIGHHQPAQ